ESAVTLPILTPDPCLLTPADRLLTPSLWPYHSLADFTYRHTVRNVPVGGNRESEDTTQPANLPALWPHTCALILHRPQSDFGVPMAQMIHHAVNVNLSPTEAKRQVNLRD